MPVAVSLTPAVSSTDDVKLKLEQAMASIPADFGGFSVGQEMDIATFQKLVKAIVPDMCDQESKALFLSMDASLDGMIQECEIFSEMTLSILQHRMQASVSHPLEGSYQCLPRPPFYPDPTQMEAIQQLKGVFDAVVVAHRQPVPTVPVAKRQGEQPAARKTTFASIFGSMGRAKAAAPAPSKVVEVPTPAPNAPKGAYLYGGCGCGKTVLLDLFFRSLPEGFTARRLHWHEFIRDAFRAMQGHPPGDDIFAAMADGMARQFRVLLLDELLITHISEAILVKKLFQHMWARGMTVITTSNYRPEELYAKGFNRDQFVDFIPQLAAQCPIVDMSNDKDYRQTDGHRTLDFFCHPISDATAASMNRMFEEVVGWDVERDVSVPIPMEKRSLKVPLAGRDARGMRVARFSFADLCGKNLGRADYSVIAENFHTLFIDDVPQFCADLGAEFRRFVSLTDILYGKKVALYMQSAVHTDDLFALGMDRAHPADMDLDELWAFRRCSSMLSEMQNAKYHHMVWLMRNHMLQESALRL